MQKILLKVALTLVIFVACIFIVEDKFDVLAYLDSRKIRSNLYESHYKAFDSANFANFSPKQNLIVILADKPFDFRLAWNPHKILWIRTQSAIWRHFIRKHI